MNIFCNWWGENGCPGTEYEIKKFDEEIVKMSGKNEPNLLFVSITQ